MGNHSFCRIFPILPEKLFRSGMPSTFKLCRLFLKRTRKWLMGETRGERIAKLKCGSIIVSLANSSKRTLIINLQWSRCTGTPGISWTSLSLSHQHSQHLLAFLGRTRPDNAQQATRRTRGLTAFLMIKIAARRIIVVTQMVVCFWKNLLL